MFATFNQNRITYIFFFLPFLLLSCTPNPITKKTFTYQLKDINVEQLDPKGKLQFVFKTKDANFIESSTTAKANDSLLTVYQEGKQYYEISSKQASISNNGQSIQLEKDVFMKSLSNDKFKLTTDLITWNQEDSTALLSGGIESNIDKASFTAEKAIYKHKENIIIFTGIKNLIYIDTEKNSTINVYSNEALWDGNTNKLIFGSNKEQVRSNIKLFKGSD